MHAPGTAGCQRNWQTRSRTRKITSRAWSSLRTLPAAIATLPERNRLMLTLYYFEGLTLREIGGLLGVTESRVSQMHTDALATLRRHLAQFQEEDDRDTAPA